MVKLRRAQEDALLAVLILECSIGIIWSSGDKYIGQQKVERGGGGSFLTLGQCSLSVGKPQHHGKTGAITPGSTRAFWLPPGWTTGFGSLDSPQIASFGGEKF